MAKPRLGEFLKCLSSDWLGLMSGGISVPFAYWATFQAPDAQKILFAALAYLCMLLLVYRVWQNAELRIIDMQRKVEEVATNLSLAYHNATLTFINQFRQLDVGIIFENKGDVLLQFQVVEIVGAINGLGVTNVPPSIPVNIHAHEQRTFHFRLEGLPQIDPSGPITVTLGFSAHYDNIPANRKRYCTRHITWNYSFLVPPMLVSDNVNKEEDGFVD